MNDNIPRSVTSTRSSEDQPRFPEHPQVGDVFCRPAEPIRWLRYRWDGFNWSEMK